MRIGLLVILIAALGAAAYMYRTDIPYLKDFFPDTTKTKNTSKPKSKKTSAKTTKKKKELNLDKKTKAQIREYFKGVEVKPENNNVKYAIHLDYQVGKNRFPRANLKKLTEHIRKY